MHSDKDIYCTPCFLFTINYDVRFITHAIINFLGECGGVRIQSHTSYAEAWHN